MNPARGSVVDEEAVVAALQAGRLGGYAADVYEMEDWARPDRPDKVDGGLSIAKMIYFYTPHRLSSGEVAFGYRARGC